MQRPPALLPSGNGTLRRVTRTRSQNHVPGPPKEDTVMKLTACLSLIVAVLVSVSTAEALTDRDRLEKLVQQNGSAPRPNRRSTPSSRQRRRCASVTTRPSPPCWAS